MNLFILLGALGWDTFPGEPPSAFHPTVWMGKYIRFFWNLNKKHNPVFDFIWGSLLMILGLLLFTGPLFFLFAILDKQVPFVRLIVAIPLLKVSFSIRYLFKAAGDVLTALENKDIMEARRLTAWHLVSRETSELSKEQIVSAVIESVSENITDSFISPVFYFFLLGIPGAWGFRFINTSDAMIAYRNAEFEWGGKPTAWLDSFFNLIPARITGMGIVLTASLMRGFSGKQSYHTLKKDHRKTASPNAGWTMSAMAGALGVTLEKIGDYRLNGGSGDLNTRAIRKCLKLTFFSLLNSLLFLLFLYEGILWIVNMAV